MQSCKRVRDTVVSSYLVSEERGVKRKYRLCREMMQSLVATPSNLRVAFAPDSDITQAEYVPTGDPQRARGRAEALNC